jgi:ActR/RegA family two-component response regulator
VEIDRIFKGRRILIVEDVPSLASAVVDMLASLGAILLGPVDRLADAVVAIARFSPEFVVVDMNLSGTSAAPVVEYLIARGVRCVITTGHSSGAKAPPFVGIPILFKPYQPQDVIAALTPMLAMAN